MTTPIYFYKTKNLSNLKPSSLVAVKTEGDTTFSLYVTDNSGLPYPLKESAGGTITAIQNTDGNLTITGTTTKTINISSSLLYLIESALKLGDNISNLVNDANYITLTDIPVFVASNYDLGDFTNTGVDPFVHLSDLNATQDKNWIYTQNIPNNVWSITHPLNKFPSISIKDSAGTNVYGEINYIDISTLTITFNSSFSGVAILN